MKTASVPIDGGEGVQRRRRSFPKSSEDDGLDRFNRRKRDGWLRIQRRAFDVIMMNSRDALLP